MKKKLNIPKDFWKDFKDRKDFDASKLESFLTYVPHQLAIISNKLPINV